MDSNFPNHTPNCKIPPCKGGCQNVVCHEHANCCMGGETNESSSCSPQCRNSYHLLDSWRFQYNNTEIWPANWKEKYATLRKNWSYHSKFTNYSLQRREDLSDEDITITNVKCGILNCSDAYAITEAAISKYNKCSCATKNTMGKENLASSYYVHRSEIPTHLHSHFEPSSRTCSRDCPNQNNEQYYSDGYESHNESSRYSSRNRSNSSPGRYTRTDNVHEMSTSRYKNYGNTDDSMYVDESYVKPDVSNSRRHRERGGGSRACINPRQDYEEYINIDPSCSTIYQNTHPVSPNAHINKKEKRKTRKSKYDEVLADVSKDLSIVYNEHPKNKSNVKQSSITLSFKEQHHNSDKKRKN